MKRTLSASVLLLGSSLAAMAQEAQQLLPGQPHPWQLGLQEPMGAMKAQIDWFSTYTLWFIVPITIFVAALLGWVAFRYRASRNPTPSRTSHNTAIEVVWTLAPVLILLFLAIPSFQLLTAQYNPPREPEVTIKATGYQWYWGYEYQPNETDAAADGAAAAEAGAVAEPLTFLSYPLEIIDDSANREAAGKTDMNVYPRLLGVDNEMVVPVDTVVRLLTTGGDVIHSFALPSLGVKVDSVPGRINEYWFEANREGIFYGQCSELCGRLHAYMPIGVRVVSREQYDNWLAAAAENIDAANAQLTAEIEAAQSVVVSSN